MKAATRERNPASMISRRTALKAGLGLLGSLSFMSGDASSDDAPPDIFIVVLDALQARSLPMYGCPRNTAPFLSDIARRAKVFERCYAGASWTKPSVTSILTGLLPLEHGCAKNDVKVPAASVM